MGHLLNTVFSLKGVHSKHGDHFDSLVLNNYQMKKKVIPSDGDQMMF